MPKSMACMRATSRAARLRLGPRRSRTEGNLSRFPSVTSLPSMNEGYFGSPQPSRQELLERNLLEQDFAVGCGCRPEIDLRADAREADHVEEKYVQDVVMNHGHGFLPGLRALRTDRRLRR